MRNDKNKHNIRSVKSRREKPVINILSRDYLVMQPLIKWLRDIAPRYASGALLDFGCGNKPYYQFFETRVDKYIGVDVEQNENNSVDHVINSNAPLPFSDNSVNTVLSTQVLEHTSEPDDYIKEISRVLKPGGHFILTCPGSYMLHEEPNDYFRYTEYGLKHLLKKNNLDVIRIDTAGGAWRLMGQIFLNHKTFGKKIKIPILTGLLFYSYIIFTNIFFALFDNLNNNKLDPANYMVISRKID
ncbi:MAG: class I SAM-dependent methyltransferase [Bacteroidota bacterium]|nr:class I SAM-dependent methyltransferase [Bacteroidota bacterium]